MASESLPTDLAPLLALLASYLPGWSAAEPRVSVLAGGITNRNYRVETARGAFVLRVAGRNTHLLGIDRRAEHAASLRAASLGIGPEVVAFLEREGCLVTRFVDGTAIPPEAMRGEAALARVAGALRRFHDGPPIPGAFSPFRVLDEYAATAVLHGMILPAAYQPCRDRARRIEAALAARAAANSAAPCHNDLLNANFLEEDGRMVILDWEYAGMSDRFFDLGNFAANHDLTEDDEQHLLIAYFGAVGPATLAHLRLMRVMSDCREAMWGVVQQGISRLDFDFADYAARHFARAQTQMEDPRFETWLGDVAGE